MSKKAMAATRKRTMFWLLGVLVAFVILDGIITEVLLAQGLARESNPFLEPLVGETVFLGGARSGFHPLGHLPPLAEARRDGHLGGG